MQHQQNCCEVKFEPMIYPITNYFRRNQAETDNLLPGVENPALDED